MPEKQKVIVIGDQGVIGASAAAFYGTQGWQVVGFSRRPPVPGSGLEHVQVDLLNPPAVVEALRPHADASRLVFAAYAERPTPGELVDINVALLRNTLSALDHTGSSVQHVTLYQGGKAYGAHLGPFKTPGREDDPRHMPPNFYYDQEDVLREWQPARRWTILRPEAVCGFAVGNPMNLSMVIAVYAAICRELGVPFAFPGTEAAYSALYQVTSADILARATFWAGGADTAAQEIFNITNGDYFRWKNLWPSLAQYFGLPYAPPLPLRLAVQMADKEPLWAKMTEKYGLQPIAYRDIASWAFGDFIFHAGFDNITSTIKARRAGFHDCIDTEEMFVSLFDEFRRRKVIP